MNASFMPTPEKERLLFCRLGPFRESKRNLYSTLFLFQGIFFAYGQPINHPNSTLFY